MPFFVYYFVIKGYFLNYMETTVFPICAVFIHAEQKKGPLRRILRRSGSTDRSINPI